MGRLKLKWYFSVQFKVEGISSYINNILEVPNDNASLGFSSIQKKNCMDRLYRTSSWLKKVFELVETSVQNFLKSPKRNTFSSSALLSGPSVVLLFYVVQFKFHSTFFIITLLHGVYDGINYNTERLIIWFLRIYFVICQNIYLKKN